MSKNRFIPKPALYIARKWRRGTLFRFGPPYEFGVKLQRSLLSQPWVQRSFYAQRVAVIRKWVALCSLENAQDAIVLGLMNNTWQGWRMSALKHPEVVEKWFQVEGLEYLRQALEQGRGILLLTLHTLRSGLIQRAVHRVSDQEVHLFAGKVDEKEENMVMATYVRRVIETHKKLQQGEIIVIGADGLRGNTAVTLPFYGRAFPFRSGFADLAVRTDAVALAVFIYYELDGRVILEFSEPIQAGPGTHEARVNELVRHYARILTDRWPRLIPSVSWRKLKQILAMPPAQA